MHIAIFGGSFDPPHVGHVFAATYARVVAGVDAVWILPVATHPYAKPLSPWSQRWDLCQAAFANLGPWTSVRNDELRNPSGYTFDLITHLLDEHPSYRFSLIGGTDTAEDLGNWHRGSELAKLVDIIVIPRGNHNGTVDARALPAISSSLVRQRLVDREPVTGFVPAAVERMIYDRRWYVRATEQ